MSAFIGQSAPVRAQLSLPPAVAIVGRPNVGKSALFNRLAGRRISIVHDQPGVTRDRLHAMCKLGVMPFEVVDTGGIGGGIGDGFEEHVEHEVDIAVAIAALIVFVVDAQEGVVPLDQSVAEKLRRAGKPILLAINKVDHPKHEGAAAEFSRLGIQKMVCISAAHGRGIGELVEAIVTKLPAGSPSEAVSIEPAAALDESAQRPLRIALAGRPNVGKSSLLNAILGAPRAIVSSVPGTTRDAVDTPFEYGGRKFLLVDTAGLRHRRRHNSSVEVFSAMRSQENIERADICLLLIDATTGVTAQDKQIAGLVQEAQRPCIVVGSKWDLIKPSRGAKETMAEWVEEMRSRLFFLDFAPMILLSSLTGENVPRIFREVRKVESASRRRITTGALNRLLAEVQTANPPPARGGRRLKILYGTAVEAKRKDGAISLPAFVLFVNDPGLMSPPYLKHIERKIRSLEPYPGLPLIFQLRGRQRTGNNGLRDGRDSAPLDKAAVGLRLSKSDSRKSNRPAARTKPRAAAKRKP